jgi:hypothetical protein
MSDDRAPAPALDGLPDERHVPLTTREVVDLCVESVDPSEREHLEAVADLLGAVLHAAYRDRWLEVKRLHAADDDARFVAELRTLLDAANYEEVPRNELERALEEESVFRLRLDIDLDDFAEVVVHRRGSEERTETVRRWYGLRREQVRFVDYARVVLYARYRERAYFEDRGDDVDDLPFTRCGVTERLSSCPPERAAAARPALLGAADRTPVLGLTYRHTIHMS